MIPKTAQTPARDRSSAIEARHDGSGDHASSFTWSMTFLLLSLVAAIFSFGGTVDGVGGHLGRVAAVGFLALAIAMFFIRRSHKITSR